MREISEIISILKEFYSISGFRVSIHDLECNEIYAYPPKLSEILRKNAADRKHKAKMP